MKAFILAGGRGTRLGQLTKDMPKPMLPLQGKPILEWGIEMLRQFDVYDIIVSIGYKGEQIKEFFGDGSKFGVKITYVEENEPLGTAGPLLMAKNLLNETFVLMNADELKNINLHEMYEFHKANNSMATIALTTVKDPSQYGVAKLRGNKIIEFVEKPKLEDAPSKLINAGLCIMEPELLNLIPKRSGLISMEREVYPKVAEGGKLFGYKFTGQWFDTGTPERYELTMREWKGFKRL